MISILSVVLGAWAIAMQQEDTPPTDQDQMQGIWRIVGVDVNGARQSAESFENHRILVTAKGHYVVIQGDRLTRGKLTLAPAHSPKHYDVEVTSGPSKGLKFNGIYEFRGDAYRTCLPLGGQDRPTRFEGKQGLGCIVHDYQRIEGNVLDAWREASHQELAGTWQSVSYAKDGIKLPDEAMKTIQLVIDENGTLTATNQGKIFIKGKCTLDANAGPMTIDITYSEGEPNGSTSLGIYMIEEDVLTICRAPPDQERPSEFQSLSGTGHTLMSYKRTKPESK